MLLRCAFTIAVCSAFSFMLFLCCFFLSCDYSAAIYAITTFLFFVIHIVVLCYFTADTPSPMPTVPAPPMPLHMPFFIRYAYACAARARAAIFSRVLFYVDDAMLICCRASAFTLLLFSWWCTAPGAAIIFCRSMRTLCCLRCRRWSDATRDDAYTLRWWCVVSLAHGDIFHFCLLRWLQRLMPIWYMLICHAAICYAQRCLRYLLMFFFHTPSCHDAFYVLCRATTPLRLFTCFCLCVCLMRSCWVSLRSFMMRRRHVRRALLLFHAYFIRWWAAQHYACRCCRCGPDAGCFTLCCLPARCYCSIRDILRATPLCCRLFYHILRYYFMPRRAARCCLLLLCLRYCWYLAHAMLLFDVALSPRHMRLQPRATCRCSLLIFFCYRFRVMLLITIFCLWYAALSFFSLLIIAMPDFRYCCRYAFHLLLFFSRAWRHAEILIFDASAFRFFEFAVVAMLLAIIALCWRCCLLRYFMLPARRRCLHACYFFFFFFYCRHCYTHFFRHYFTPHHWCCCFVRRPCGADADLCYSILLFLRCRRYYVHAAPVFVFDVAAAAACCSMSSKFLLMFTVYIFVALPAFFLLFLLLMPARLFSPFSMPALHCHRHRFSFLLTMFFAFLVAYFVLFPPRRCWYTPRLLLFICLSAAFAVIAPFCWCRLCSMRVCYARCLLSPAICHMMLLFRYCLCRAPRYYSPCAFICLHAYATRCRYWYGACFAHALPLICYYFVAVAIVCCYTFGLFFRSICHYLLFHGGATCPFRWLLIACCCPLPLLYRDAISRHAMLAVYALRYLLSRYFIITRTSFYFAMAVSPRVMSAFCYAAPRHYLLIISCHACYALLMLSLRWYAAMILWYICCYADVLFTYARCAYAFYLRADVIIADAFVPR